MNFYWNNQISKGLIKETNQPATENNRVNRQKSIKHIRAKPKIRTKNNYYIIYIYVETDLVRIGNPMSIPHCTNPIGEENSKRRLALSGLN